MFALAAMLAVLPGPSARADQVSAAQVSSLAESGDFDLLLARLKADGVGLDVQQVGTLIQDLEAYQQNQAKRQASQLEAYQEALEKVRKELNDEKVESALVASIEAHSLAPAPQTLLDDGAVRSVVKRAEAAAEKAEADHDWVEATSLYRLLNLLYEDDRRYQAQIDRSGRHVRVLQLYAPLHLQQLYRDRAERRALEKGEDKPEPITLEIEPWTERLTNIELPMLRQTLAQAARRHVGKDGYLPLVQGGLENLLVMVDNPAITNTFPSLKNEAKRQQFHDFLIREADKLNTPGKTLNFLETATIIDKVIDVNDMTVNLPEQVVVYELTEGATDELDDFSTVIWPDDIPAFLRTTQGEFKGIGVQISKRDGELVVVSPLADTPAHRAGIKADDVIAKVNGVSTANWTLTKAVDRITGEAGTKVELEIKRKGEPELIKYTIVRAPIPIESIRGWEHTHGGEWDYWIDRDAGIGYVRMSAFLPQTVEDLDRAVMQMQQDRSVEGLILDLRFNPGGLLSSAVDVVDRFISQGSVVFTVDGDGDRTHESKAKRHTTYRRFPVVVLINQGSASASEIVSGALQDYSRAVIIGNRSFGKGSVQDLFPLAHGKAYLKLTTQYYQLPLGRIIHRKTDAAEWGIEPDLNVAMTDKQVADWLEFRQKVDVLLREGETLRDEDGNAIPQPLAREILVEGLDPQLETALLVLKARRLADDLAMAQAGRVVNTH